MSSSSSDSEVFEFAPSKVRPARVAPSAPSAPVNAVRAVEPGTSSGKSVSRSPGPDAEERYEALESIGEALEELKKAYEGIGSACAQLEAESQSDVPQWLKTLGEAAASPTLAAVAEALDAVAEELAREKDRVCGAGPSGGSGKGGKALRAYLSAMRSHHTKKAKQCDSLLKSMVEERESVALSPAAVAAAPEAAAATVNTSGPLPGSTAAAAGRPPPPLPSRRGQAPAEEDPFAEQPIDPSAVTRARAKSSVGGTALPVPTGGRTAPSPTPANVSPPASPRGESVGTPPPPSSSPPSAAPGFSKTGSTVSPRGRGGGRRGVDLGGQRRLANSQNTQDPSSGPAALGPLEWGSLDRPLKPLTRAGDLELIQDTVVKFEAQRKGGLLLSNNFSLTVTAGADPSISIYDVKQQSNVTRSLTGVLKVTRSNKNSKKLKIHWRTGEGCDRFLFASSVQREQFVEAMWSFRSTVPQPFLYAEPIEIFIGTWNLGEAMPAADIGAWLHPHEFDLYVVSAQEAGYDLEKGQSGNAEAHFFALIASTLGPDYQMVAQLSLLHIRHCVYVAKRHAHKVSNVRKASVATGIGNVIGNKGGCFVSMNFNETSLCFVGCHLAAREERFEQRCQNVQQILQGINAEQPSGLGPDTWFDHVFWTGDLNYRLTADRSDVCRWAKECNVESLLQSDQLMLARRENKAFYQFTEPPIAFSPSYRFDRGSSEFSEEKMRTPSYCDRVLYKSKPGLNVSVTRYDCVHSLTTSDHHPVYAALVIDTRLPSPATVRTSACYLELTELAGKDMSFVALDREAPFLALYTPLAKSRVSKRSVIRGPTPKWADASVPRLKMLVATRAVLSLSHLSIAVRDGKNEVGQCVLSLADACGPQPAEFVAPLVNGGLPAGELRGKMHFKWSGGAAVATADESEIFNDEQSVIAGPGGAAGGAGAGAGAGAGGEEVLKSGFLLKQGSKVKSWKRRWFVFASNGELAYFADRKAPKPLDKLVVEEVSKATNAGKMNCIAIKTGKRVLLFCADNTSDFDSWMAVLTAYCEQAH